MLIANITRPEAVVVIEAAVVELGEDIVEMLVEEEVVEAVVDEAEVVATNTDRWTTSESAVIAADIRTASRAMGMTSIKRVTMDMAVVRIPPMVVKGDTVGDCRITGISRIHEKLRFYFSFLLFTPKSFRIESTATFLSGPVLFFP